MSGRERKGCNSMDGNGGKILGKRGVSPPVFALRGHWDRVQTGRPHGSGPLPGPRGEDSRVSQSRRCCSGKRRKFHGGMTLRERAHVRAPRFPVFPPGTSYGLPGDGSSGRAFFVAQVSASGRLRTAGRKETGCEPGERGQTGGAAAGAVPPRLHPGGTA